MRLVLPTLAIVALSSSFAESYRERLLSDQPVAYWRFDDIQQCCTPNETHEALRADAGANVSLLEAGPRPPGFPLFQEENTAADFTHFRKDTFLRVKDTGPLSVFDFAKDQTITIEAWVRCLKLADGQNVYVAGKGRTGNPGVAANNQNWALRLRGLKSGDTSVACASFLFRDENSSGDASWHRFTGTRGFTPGQEWHHVTATYTFGKPDSARLYVNGEETPGTWDMGGPTTAGPVVDDDEVWIGGSMGGAESAQFPGQIDELAIYRTALAPDRIKEHALREGPAPALKPVVVPVAAKKKDPELPPLPVVTLKPGDLPAGKVRVEIFEFPVVAESGGAEIFGDDAMKKKDDGGSDATWGKFPPDRTEEFIEPFFALGSAPSKYSERGVKIDRSRPYLVRLAGVVTLPSGPHTLHLRALGGTRLAWDGEVIAQTPLKRGQYNDTEPVPDQLALQIVKEMPLLSAGHREVQARLNSDGKPHVLVIETWVGGKRIRPELGEISLWSNRMSAWSVVDAGPNGGSIAPAEYEKAIETQRNRIAALSAQRRRNPNEDGYWKKRHELGAQHAKTPPAPPSNGAPTPVDAFIAEKLQREKATAAALADDAAFLRRVTLDTIGLIPTTDETTSFLADKSPDKRSRAIDRLLADPRWADHWTSYWQDVLAENPNILKGTLNNTGPFRWWIHESLLDNKPMDRFATELISMEGSPNYGGPAGFAIASQNDLPMAAKAQILASAFLANEMKCARCHDAVHHSFEQKELFQIAAVLQRAPIKVPETSLTKGLSKNSHVAVTLKAGDIIEPHFPFGGIKEPLPTVIRRPGDPREMFAAILTDPRNDRFARVVVNRLWKQFLGFGIVEPVDDWETSQPSHPELLQWLAYEFITHGYDLKHVAKLILNSQTYQRVPTTEAMKEVTSSHRLFASQARRRMTAEQLLDSLMQLTGQRYDTELLTFDPEGRQASADQSNLGVPRRAWEFAALSNERDRPALAKPRAQIFTDILAAFGWRESRPEPRSTRDHAPNVIQPALLANGTFGALITRPHDANALTTLALQSRNERDLVRQMYLSILSRLPSDEEIRRVSAYLQPGYANRLTGAPPAPPLPRNPKAVSWANHLNPDATTTVLAIEREVKAGPIPTPRLTTDWRDRYEDALWALMLSPELTWIP
jgi:hypothetical protein